MARNSVDATAPSDAGAVPPAPRVALWDNARFLTVTLVVIGHGIQRLTAESDAALVAYLFIYGFHVPAFAIISGYFSKAESSARQARRVITDLIVPYLVMETIWSFLKLLVRGSSDFDPSTASWTLWFLLALAFFRLILPYLALLRLPLLWAVVGSVGVGYFSNIDSTFSTSRAIGLLPFFLLGWQLREWRLAERWIGVGAGVRRTVRVAAIAVFAAWLIVLAVSIDGFREGNLGGWLFYDDSYQGIGEDRWWAGLVRLGLILVATLLSLAFLALVPLSRSRITPFGQATMYVYLLHSFVLFPIRESGLLQRVEDPELWLVVMVLTSIAIAVALSTPIVRRVFRAVVEPPSDWIFRDRSAPTTRRD